MRETLSHRSTLTWSVVLACLSALCGCADIQRDVESLLVPTLQRSEIVGSVAGFGTTFAAFPDLLAMLRKQATANMHPRMAAIMGTFQILWMYYGLLIGSRPVVVWNMIAIIINFLNVGAYWYFARKEEGGARNIARESAAEVDRPRSEPAATSVRPERL